VRPLHRGHARLLLALVALGAQAAALADALFVAHVTCLADGERIHVADAARRTAPEPWTSTDATDDGTVAADEHTHGQCLVDDDAECPAASPTGPLVLPEPAGASALVAVAERRLPGPPLYQLAPKNSPPT
jgi:hypothetical protein